MNSEVCGKAAQAFINALICYLQSNAMRTIKIASLTGQDNVRISLRAFMRCHDPSSGFAKVEEVVNTLTECSGGSWIEKLGWSLTLEDKELCFIVPLEDLIKLVQQAHASELTGITGILLRRILSA